MSGEVEKCPILHVRPKFDVFTLVVNKQKKLNVFLSGLALQPEFCMESN